MYDPSFLNRFLLLNERIISYSRQLQKLLQICAVALSVLKVGLKCNYHCLPMLP